MTETIASLTSALAEHYRLEWAVDHGFHPYRFFAEWCPFMQPLRGMPELHRIVAKAAQRAAELTT